MKNALPITILLLLLASHAQAAAPDINLFRPDGNQTLKGQYSIDWETRDSDGDDLNASIYYGLTSGSKTWTIIADIPINNSYCSSDGNLEAYNRLTAGTATPRRLISHAVFTLDQNIRLIEIGNKAGTDFNVHVYDWNGSGWDHNIDLRNGIPEPFNKGTFVESFQYNGTPRLIINTPDGVLLIRKWNGDGWVDDNALLSGIDHPGNKIDYGHFFHNGTHYLLQSDTNGSVRRAYDWNGSTWNLNYDFNKGLTDANTYFSTTTQKLGLTPWVDDRNKLHLFISDIDTDDGAKTAQVIGFDWSGESWQHNKDLNNNIQNMYNFYSYTEVFTIDDNRYTLIHHSNHNDDNGIARTNYRFEYDNNTQNYQLCSYDWDTTFVDDGNYFIDIEATDGTDTNTDSSTTSFGIDNLQESDENNFVGTLCQSVVYNGDINGKIDVGFIGSGFPSKTKFAQVVNELIDYDGNGPGLMSYKPFSDYNTSFNFWRVDLNETYAIVESQLGSRDWNKIENQAIQDIIDNCSGMNQGVVISVKPAFRSYGFMDLFRGEGHQQAFLYIGEEYLQNCQEGEQNCTAPWPLLLDNPDPDTNYGANRNHLIRTFVHEFGHSFGGLADEYKSYDYDFNNQNPNWRESIPDVVNCDFDTNASNICTKWDKFDSNENKITCDLNCTYKNWYRPYDNTIMKDHYLANVIFDEVNENELEKDINREQNDLNASGTVSGQASYSLSLNKKGETFTLIKSEIKIGQAPNYPDKNNVPYRLYVKGNSDTNIYDVNFSAPDKVFFVSPLDSFDENGNFIDENAEQRYFDVDDVNFTIIIPYAIDGQTVDITDENNAPLLTIDVSDLSPIRHSIVEKASKASNPIYNLSYSLTQHPIGTHTNNNYKLHIGPLYYSKEGS